MVELSIDVHIAGWLEDAIVGVETMEPQPMATRWRWTPADPYIVELIFVDDDATVWRFDRDVLQHGLIADDRWAGIGEVRITVCSHGQIRIKLENDDGMCHLRYPRAQVSAFLAQALLERPNGADLPGSGRVEHAVAQISAAAGDDRDAVIAEAEQLLVDHSNESDPET